MPTPGERRALIFIASVAALGVAARGWKEVRADRNGGIESGRSELARQIDAVDSAVASGGAKRKGRRKAASVAKDSSAADRSRAAESSAARRPAPRIELLPEPEPDPRAGYRRRMEAIDSARAAAVRRQAQLSRPGVTLVPRTAPSSSAKGTAGPVDLDVATAAEIEALPYVGPALAARIVADRNARGPFGSLAGLTRVKGVGPSLADKLAVHDIERELYGTSLGVNLDTGVAVDGGHRHHMKAINTITTAGGIRAAVEKGVLTSGVMYECVKHNVPYVLAGSIRDDGPLPDTLMDLIEAQNQYTAALEGVQVVLILSSMLHGIGVGNMLPAWVRIIAVDINPAVVTKLADRGSAQAVGLVTDVGLFLRGLAEQLRASGCDRIFARSPSRNHE